MRSGTRLIISLDETDCPLPTATNLAPLSGHHDATAYKRDIIDTSFAVAAGQLTSIIAPVYRQLLDIESGSPAYLILWANPGKTNQHLNLSWRYPQTVPNSRQVQNHTRLWVVSLTLGTTPPAQTSCQWFRPFAV
jgi:hypothetical protein